ncbi:MAG: dihydroneopterin aldolase [Spirochaetaceae bacterium]|nr:MAG: dihydroneopterin aldolase [Spirochaetaceae bacterium]
MSARVVVRGIEIDAVIGAYDEERTAPRRVVGTLEFTYDVSRAAETDSLSDAIDYGAVAECVRRAVIDAEARLLEVAAARAARRVLSVFRGVESVVVELEKTAAMSGATCAAVRWSESRTAGED